MSIDRMYLKSLLEIDLRVAQQQLKELDYSDWIETDKKVISEFLNSRKAKAEHHLNLVNSMGANLIKMVPALTDAEG